MEQLIITILWMTISTLLLFQNMESFVELTATQLLIVIVIFMLGGPIMALAAILETILSFILPEGWDDDDDFKGS